MDVQVIWCLPLVKVSAAHTSDEVDLKLVVVVNLNHDANVGGIPMVLEKISSARNGRRIEVADETVNVIHGLQDVHQDCYRGVLVRVCLIWSMVGGR